MSNFRPINRDTEFLLPRRQTNGYLNLGSVDILSLSMAHRLLFTQRRQRNDESDQAYG